MTLKGNYKQQPILLIWISSKYATPSSFLHEEFPEKDFRLCSKAPDCG